METESVTVKVPTNLLRLLQEKNYFGKTRDEWFTNCVKQGVDGELNKLRDTKRKSEDSKRSITYSLASSKEKEKNGNKPRKHKETVH